MKTDEQLLEEAENALKNIFTAIDHGWWSIDHDADCPEDDTCECNGGSAGTAKIASDALNAIEYRRRFAKDKRLVERRPGVHTAHLVQKLDVDHVVFGCGLRLFHEHVYEDGLRQVPGCFECFPEEQPDYLPPGTHLAIHGQYMKNIGCMETGKKGWTLRSASKVAAEADPGATVEIIQRADCAHDEDKEEDNHAS